jgi:hypothetical protein
MRPLCGFTGGRVVAVPGDHVLSLVSRHLLGDMFRKISPFFVQLDVCNDDEAVTVLRMLEAFAYRPQDQKKLRKVPGYQQAVKLRASH